MTFTPELEALEVALVFPPLSLATLAPEVPPEPADPYVIRVVDMFGELVTELPLADPGDITEPLNGVPTFDIKISKQDYTRDDIDVLGKTGQVFEVQILQAGEVLAWGPVTGASGGSDSDTVTFNCSGVDWYFPKRALDSPPVNRLPNNNFEDDLDGWTELGGSGNSHTTPSIISSPVIQGAKALRLTSTDGATPSRITGYKSDAVKITTGNNPAILTVTFSFIIEKYLGPAFLKGGLYVEGSRPGFGGSVPPGVNQKAIAQYNIDQTTPRNVEVRPSVSIKIPPHTTWNVEVILFGLKGSIVWDAGAMVLEKSVSVAGISGGGAAPFVDAAAVVRRIAQMALSNIFDNSKTDLNIGLILPNIGTRVSRSYAFSDHVAFDQALGEFLARDDLFDYAIRYTQTTRTLRLFPFAAGPAPACGRGTDRSADVTLTYGQAPVTGYRANLDGGAVITQVGVVGDGDGAARPEAWETDATLIGGTVLQGIIQAPPNAPLNSLRPMARAVVQQRGHSLKVVEVTIDRKPGGSSGDPEAILQDLLRIGDIITLDIEDGWLHFAGTWRIVQRVRHCRARTMTYTLNRIIL